MHSPRCPLVVDRIDNALRRQGRGTITDDARASLLLEHIELLMVPTVLQSAVPELRSALAINDRIGELLCLCGVGQGHKIDIAEVLAAQKGLPPFRAGRSGRPRPHRHVVARVWVITALTELCGRDVEEAIWMLRGRPAFWHKGVHKGSKALPVRGRTEFHRDRRRVCKAFSPYHAQPL